MIQVSDIQPGIENHMHQTISCQWLKNLISPLMNFCICSAFVKTRKYITGNSLRRVNCFETFITTFHITQNASSHKHREPTHLIGLEHQNLQGYEFIKNTVHDTGYKELTWYM